MPTAEIITGKLPWIEGGEQPQFAPLDWAAILAARGKGLVLEFGVYIGSSIRHIANAVVPEKVYGFDSFKGLAEPWSNQPIGYLSLDGPPDIKETNVELVIGLFADTLKDFLANHPGPIGYAHLDADLYSSTKYVLDCLTDRIIVGTILHFDEIKIYPGCDHEIRAFNEYLAATNTRWEILGQLTQHGVIFKRI